ncbi:AbrB/MazE/SpoVT family DNA-binding domain-containing protein [Thauera sp. Sel9]|uniref:AbrB/MazE/SpoVT family DNA-binding domain-containing protein n=1 Tax=Thauera sp. Sel9 TaxID=2974299 RepID=UPI0021E196B0|nr:type II toxin-antitoxin system PrlF family antitoxin [Thauera sp. Sel9]MCV2218351.1 type II toxin-antitoxin system PrlF family antitoxin [Thauera sp. Sel9]
MQVITTVAAKGRTTIPANIRKALHVSRGGLTAWEFGSEGTAVVRRTQPFGLEYRHAREGTLTEWAGDADEDAYRGL